MSAEEKLQAIVDMIDNWNAQYGHGTRMEVVMGRQVVSTDYLHKRIHDIVNQGDGGHG